VQGRVLHTGVAGSVAHFLLFGPQWLVAQRHVQHARGFKLCNILRLTFTQGYEIAKQTIVVTAAQMTNTVTAATNWTYYNNIIQSNEKLYFPFSTSFKTLTKLQYLHHTHHRVVPYHNGKSNTFYSKLLRSIYSDVLQ
jgi:hypothetical protein